MYVKSEVNFHCQIGKRRNKYLNPPTFVACFLKVDECLEGAKIVRWRTMDANFHIWICVIISNWCFDMTIEDFIGVMQQRQEVNLQSPFKWSQRRKMSWMKHNLRPCHVVQPQYARNVCWRLINSLMKFFFASSPQIENGFSAWKLL